MIPLLSFLFIYLRTRKRHKFLDWRLTLAIYLDDNSSRVALRTLILTLLLGINQISYAYQRGITFNYNPLYYAQVTSATQDNINAISISGTESFATYSSASSSRRLVELSENEYIPDHSFPDHTRRRLNGYSNSFVAVVYHTSDYSNLLTTANLKAICQTEKSFLNNVGCFNPSSIKSIIPSIFWNNTCVAKQFNPEAVFTSFQNEPYLQDNINYVNPTSNVVISYFDSNSCDSYSYSSFQSLLSSYTKAPIQVTFVNTHFINTQFQDITTGAYSVTGIALLITVGFLIFGLRGLLMTIAIFYTMAVAFVTAIGVLPYANYQYFSMYNIISVYMMIALGGSTMLLYGSAWRRTFPVDASITGRRILKSYQLISMAIMFVFLLAFITFVSKISSSIVVLSQLGVFLTVSYVTFFIQLHTFLIPLWISLSAYKVFPDHYRSLFEEYCEIQIVHDYGKDDFYSEGDDDDAYEELPYGEGDWEGYSQYTGSQRSPSRQPSLRVIQQSGKSGVGQVSGKSEYSTTGPRLGRDRQPIQGSHREDSLSRDTHIAIMRSLSEIDTTFKGVGSPSTVPSTNPSPDLNTSPVPNSSASIRRLSAKNSETTFEETKNGQSRKDTSPKRRASFAADESLVVEYSCADVTITEPPKNSVLRASSVSSVRAGSSVHSGATQSVRRSSLASVESLSNAIGGNPNRRMSTMTQAQSVVGFDDDVNDPRDEAKAIARYFGILSALIWLVLMVVVSAAGYARIQVSYDIPSIVSPSTNLGQAIFINQNYKLGLLVDYSDPQNMPLISTLSPSVEPSASPIQSPTVFPAGSRSPTTKPVISNQPSSLKPTAVPTSRHPSARPVAHSGAPSTAPSQSGIQSTSLQAQSYVMTGCYGISTSKPFVDVQGK